jgi:DNA modification methylase
MPYREARENREEKHVCPLQLDVIERALTLWSNPGDVVLTPFMGVGSEVFGALQNGRRAIGIELKPTYYRQACENIQNAHIISDDRQISLFDDEWNEDDTDDSDEEETP